MRLIKNFVKDKSIHPMKERTGDSVG